MKRKRLFKISLSFILILTKDEPKIYLGNVFKVAVCSGHSEHTDEVYLISHFCIFGNYTSFPSDSFFIITFKSLVLLK